MLCNKCGKEVPDNTKFCSYCGARFGESAPETDDAVIVEPQNKLRGSKKTWIALAVAIVIVAAGIGGYKLYTSPSQKMNREIKSGDYSAALEIYQDDLEQAALSSKSIKLLNTALTELQTAYDEETLAYEEILENLDILSEFSDREFRKSVLAVREIVVDQHRVNILVAEANECLKKEEYEIALLTFQDALQIDPTSEKAITGFEQARKKYIDAVLEHVADDEAKGNYDAAKSILERAAANLDNDEALLSEIDALQERYEAYKQMIIDTEILELIDQASKTFQAGNYIDAIKSVDQVRLQYPNNEKLENAYDDMCKEMVEAAIDQADSLASQEDWGDALNLLEQCIEIYPDNRLQDTYDAIMEKSQSHLKISKNCQTVSLMLRKEHIMG